MTKNLINCLIAFVLLNNTSICHGIVNIGKSHIEYTKAEKIKSKKVIAKVPIDPEFEVAGQVPVDILIPQKICPPEYELVDQNCIKSSTTEPQLVCEDGYKFLDGNCYRTEKSKAEAVCPIGYHKIGMSKCLEVTSIPPKLQCKEGILNENNKCIHIRRSDPKLKCDPGYTKSPDGFCFKADKTKPGVICPADSTPTTKGCVKYKESPPDIYCLSGFKLEDGRCVKEKYEMKMLKCAKGFVLSRDPKQTNKAECVKVIKNKGKEYCEDGEIKNGKCISYISTLPEIYCKPGFELKEGKCIRLLQEDPEIRCEAGFKYDGVRCVDIRIRQPSVLCSEGQIAKLGYCEKIISEPPISQCRNDFENINGKCVRKYYKEAKLKCKGGELLIDNVCKSQERVESSDICDEHSQREGHFCVSFDTVQPNIICNVDEELSHDKLSCNKKIITKPEAVCLPGFNLELDECVRSTQIQVDMICPQGADLKSHICTKTLRSAPLVSCRLGYMLNDVGECECTDIIDPTSVCPSCYTLVDDMCMPNHSADTSSQCAIKKMYRG